VFFVIVAPGRVNLIGEHIDYHNLPVLPMAIGRSVRVNWRPRSDRLIRATSIGYGTRQFEWTPDLAPVAAGDWENYLRAAAEAIERKWGLDAAWMRRSHRTCRPPPGSLRPRRCWSP
jgi:galactokinase